MARKRRNRRRGKKVGKATKKYVQKAIASQIEDKVRIVGNTIAAGLVANITPAPNVPPLLANGYYPYFSMARGTAEGQRIANRIRIKDITVRGMIAAGAVNLIQTSRLIFFRDTKANATQPALADILEDTATPNTSPNYTYNMNNVGTRFKILFDKLTILKPTTATNTGLQKLIWKKKYKKGILIQFNDNNATDYTDVISGNHWMLHITHAAATPPFAWLDVQYHYEDA